MNEITLTASEIAQLLKISKQAVMKKANKEAWSFTEERTRGGSLRKYSLAALPGDIQNAYIYKEGESNPNLTALLPSLAPDAAKTALDILSPMDVPTMTSAMTETRPSWTPEMAISEKDLQDPRVRKILAVLREVDRMPSIWKDGRRKWVENVALRNGCTFQAVYRWIKRYEKKGIAGICHRKASAGKPKAWTLEAIDFWVSLCGKREHRAANRRALYDQHLMIEAHRRGWNIGTYASANGWFKKRWNPLLEAMQRGGLRALDNVLPPILRDYSDLKPFEILVGDQHRFNRWVVDEETGEVYRPEGYLWQDLRTRIIYGAALDRKYDAWLIGLALRIGIGIFGAFDSIYTDNGKPECSRYLTGILANMRSLGMEWRMTDDAVMDLLDVDGEDIDPHIIVPGVHRKAVVKNAKAKMIEGTFDVVEGIMSSRFLLPGQTKRLSDDIHWQDIDHAEALSLAKEGKLLTGREHALALYRTVDWYNREKAHRGVKREWSWKSAPAQTTPFDCLRACYEGGWRPRMVSKEAADLLFLARDRRIVDRGRIQFNNEFWEHDALLTYHKRRLDIRYNPMTLDELHVFLSGQYLCTALPVEKSSMIDRELASRKIAEKRERRKRFAEEFRRISAIAPDFREYSQVPAVERAAALIGQEKKKQAAERLEFFRELSPEELAAGVAELEALQEQKPQQTKPLPARPTLFLSDCDRHLWCVKYESLGGRLTDEDKAWMEAHEAQMTEAERARWQFEREYAQG